MRVLFAGAAFAISLAMLTLVAAILLHPLHVLGVHEWRWLFREFDWSEIAIIAAIAIGGTVFLCIGISLARKSNGAAD